MPGNVAAPAPNTVMPAFLAANFELAHSFEGDVNAYADGSYQAKALTTASRKVWRAAVRLAPTQLAELRAFFNAHGNSKAFWFYFWRETSPAGSVDPTGSSTIGRYACVFVGEWSEAAGLGRVTVSLQIMEVA